MVRHWFDEIGSRTMRPSELNSTLFKSGHAWNAALIAFPFPKVSSFLLSRSNALSAPLPGAVVMKVERYPESIVWHLLLVLGAGMAATAVKMLATKMEYAKIMLVKGSEGNGNGNEMNEWKDG